MKTNGLLELKRHPAFYASTNNHDIYFTDTRREDPLGEAIAAEISVHMRFAIVFEFSVGDHDGWFSFHEAF
jgi:hypothetical protein